MQRSICRDIIHFSIISIRPIAIFILNKNRSIRSNRDSQRLARYCDILYKHVKGWTQSRQLKYALIAYGYSSIGVLIAYETDHHRLHRVKLDDIVEHRSCPSP